MKATLENVKEFMGSLDDLSIKINSKLKS